MLVTMNVQKGIHIQQDQTRPNVAECFQVSKKYIVTVYYHVQHEII